MTTAFVTALALSLATIQAAPLTLTVSMISLGVTDMIRSTKFYRETLGLQLVGKPGEVTQFRAGDITIVLNRPAGRAARKTLAGVVEIIFPVDNVTYAYSTLTQRGCHFIATPHEVTSGVWAATFTDPDEHLLTVLGPK